MTCFQRCTRTGKVKSKCYEIEVREKKCMELYLSMLLCSSFKELHFTASSLAPAKVDKTTSLLVCT